MTELYKKVEDYVRESFSKDGQLSTRGTHLLKTKEWLLKIFPDADEAMQIAALAHDIDSAFVEFKGGGSFRDPDYLAWHQKGAADLINNFLIQQGATNELAERVHHLVLCHEIGGDKEQDIIKDADSLGFFDRDVQEFFVRRMKGGSSKDDLREKIDWMYERISTEKARQLAKPMYEEALGILEKQ